MLVCVPMKNIINILSYVAIGLFVVVVGLLIVSSFRIPFISLDARAVLTGSMEPAIPTGSVVFIRPYNEYKEGDIITFRRADSETQTPITHRVMGREFTDGMAVYVTQGDANEYADTTVVHHSEIYGKVIWHLPYIGRLLELSRTPFGFMLIIILPALLVVIDESRKVWAYLRRDKISKETTDESI